MTDALSALDLDSVPGTVSVQVGGWRRPPAFARAEHETHYAASTMKLAVLGALFATGEDLDTRVPVVNEFESAVPGAGRFSCDPAEDGDAETWDLLGRSASLRWLARRMIVRSGNLATNILLSRLGTGPVTEFWRAAGARHSAVGRLIEDRAAARAGITNPVTAADLTVLLHAVAHGEPLSLLLAQEVRDDLAAGLPPNAVIAHKNGWVTGVRHGAGLVLPPDAPPYTVVVCTTSELPQAAACRLVARVAAASWADRHSYA